MEDLKDYFERKNYFSSTLGFLGIIITIILSFYFGTIYEKKSKITIEVLSEFNVFDINKSIDKLKIYYENTDIKKQNLNLKICVVKIYNNGQIDIVTDDFESKFPLGIKINKGKIIEYRIVDSENDYLKQNINPVIKNEKELTFANVIFNRSDYFVVEVLIIHDKNTPITFDSLGRVKGINSIQVYQYRQKTETKSFAGQVAYGNFAVHVVRFFMYFLVIILFAIAIAIITWIINSFVEKSRKDKILPMVKKLKIGDELKTLIARLYISDSLSGLKRMKYLLEKGIKIDEHQKQQYLSGKAFYRGQHSGGKHSRYEQYELMYNLKDKQHLIRSIVEAGVLENEETTRCFKIALNEIVEKIDLE